MFEFLGKNRLLRWATLLFVLPGAGVAARAEEIRPIPLVIFTDAEVDDALTILAALGDPRVDLQGICVAGTGFADRDEGVETVLRLVAFAAAREGDSERRAALLSLAVSRGSETPIDSAVNLEAAILNADPPLRPLSNSLWHTREEFFPTRRGLEASTLSCAEMLAAAAQENSGLQLLTIGPSTDVALALRAQPSIAERIARNTIMGGALFVAGNLFSVPSNTVAEFNFYLDVTAAKEVLASGIPTRIVALDAINDVRVTREFYQGAIAGLETDTGRWYRAALESARDVLGDAAFFNDERAAGGGFSWWDLLAYQTLIQGGCDSGASFPVAVDATPGPAGPSGQLRKEYGEPDGVAEICLGFDPGKAEAFLVEVVGRGAN